MPKVSIYGPLGPEVGTCILYHCSRNTNRTRKVILRVIKFVVIKHSTPWTFYCILSVEKCIKDEVIGNNTLKELRS